MAVNKGNYMGEYEVNTSPTFEYMQGTNGLGISEQLASQTLNILANVCRKDNDKWWHDPHTQEPIKRNKGELLMLMVSEIAEAMEGERKDLMDTHLPHRKMVEVELADLLIRTFDYAAEHGLDLGGALVEKRRYNAQRKDHTFEERSKSNGKRF